VLVSITGQEPKVRDVPVTNAMWLDDVLSHVDGAAPERPAYTVVPASGVPPRVPSISLQPLVVPLVMLSRPSLVRPDAREALRVVKDSFAAWTRASEARPSTQATARHRLSNREIRRASGTPPPSASGARQGSGTTPRHK
jgi:hypothetical protein